MPAGGGGSCSLCASHEAGPVTTVLFGKWLTSVYGVGGGIMKAEK